MYGQFITIRSMAAISPRPSFQGHGVEIEVLQPAFFNLTAENGLQSKTAKYAETVALTVPWRF